MKKECHSTNNMEHEIWFFTSQRQVLCEWEQKNLGSKLANSLQYMMVKTCTNLSREEVSKTLDSNCNRRRLFHYAMVLSTIVTPHIPWLHLCVPPNPYAHPTFKYFKIVWRNPTVPTVDHINKWESVKFMESYYVVGLTTILYLGYGVIINIDLKEDNLFWVKNW